MTVVVLIILLMVIVLAVAVYQIDGELRHIDDMLTTLSKNSYSGGLEDEVNELMQRMSAVEQIAYNAQNKTIAIQRRLDRGVVYESEHTGQ